MQKIVLILGIIIFSTGCSVQRSGGIKRSEPVIKDTAGSLTDVLKEQNITNESFIIEKAEIEVTGQDGTERMLANVKFSNSKEFLISIRSRAGIEAARIYISSDTILINDRINRKFIHTSSVYIDTKYGVSKDLMPLLFGDYIGKVMNNQDMEDCNNGMLNTDCLVNGLRIRYTVDCDVGKANFAVKEDSFTNQGIEFKYDNFFRNGEKWIPREIEMTDLKRQIKILIRIEKISFPWEGKTELIPGNRYEIIELL